MDIVRTGCTTIILLIELICSKTGFTSIIASALGDCNIAFRSFDSSTAYS
jgi:hypothetical protein